MIDWRQFLTSDPQVYRGQLTGNWETGCGSGTPGSDRTDGVQWRGCPLRGQVMPTLTVENVPPELYDHLQRRAEQERRSLPEETLHLLEQALRQERAATPRVPDFIATEEIAAPYDLPRSSRPVPVTARAGSPRWPDPPNLEYDDRRR
jgi:plasmid stability protein